MRNDKVKVAVVDSGIDESIDGLGKYIYSTKSYTINENGRVIESEDVEIKHHHGTAIALIIKHIYPNVEFYSFNIFDENLLSDGRILIHSIKNAIELKPDIIHLSLGTKKVKYIPKLTSLILKANRNGIIIVSAISNDGKASYPANLMGVIRVQGYNFNNFQDYHYHKGRFIAPYGLTSIGGKEELDYKKFVGNSMAAAYITGHICKSIEENRDISNEYVKNFIRHNAREHM